MVETWTYASTSSVTVDGDLTTKYTQGRKVKFTQNSTAKFFLVVSSTYNGGTDKTTISLNGQGVYTVENLPITDNYSTAWDVPGGGFPFNYTSSVKAGQIGIGTIDPEYPLHVIGDAYITGGLVGKDNTFVRIDYTTGKCMKREPTGEWAALLVDKVLTSVCCQSEKNIVGCNSAGECWQWDGEEWAQISTSPSMKYVSIGCDGSTIGRGTDTGSNNCYELVDDEWVAFYAGIFDRIASYSSTLHYLTGNNSKKLFIGNGSTFAAPGDTTALTDISVARDGSLFAIKTSDGSLVKWSGTAWGSSLGAETGIKAIAAKSGTMVWAVGSDDTLYYWNGLTWIQSSTDTVSDIAIANL